MLGLARLADRGPKTAAALAAALLLAALWLPAIVPLASALAMLFIIGSAAVVAFIALRRGELAVLRTIGVCILLLVILSLLLYRSAFQVPVIALVFWLPAILAAVVLGRSLNLGMAVLTVTLCGIVAVLGLSFVTGGDTAFWRIPLEQSLKPAVESGEAMISADQLDSLITMLADMMTGALGVAIMSIALCALFLARYWHAALVNPGGFRQEFHALALGRRVAWACLAVILLSVVVGGSVFRALAMVMIFAFFIQGLAVAHSIVRERKMNSGWLVGLYGLLLLPNTVLLVAALGLADSQFRLRKG